MSEVNLKEYAIWNQTEGACRLLEILKRDWGIRLKADDYSQYHVSLQYGDGYEKRPLKESERDIVGSAFLKLLLEDRNAVHTLLWGSDLDTMSFVNVYIDGTSYNPKSGYLKGAKVRLVET